MDIFGLERFQNRIETPLYTVGFSYDSSYHSFAKIMFKAEEQKATISDSLTINFTLDVPALYKTYLAQHPEVDQAIALAFFEGQTMVKQIDLPFTLQDLLIKNITSLHVFPGLGKGDYFMRFGIMSDSELFTHNSEKIKLTVTE